MYRVPRNVLWQRCVEKPLMVFFCVICFGLTDAVESSTTVSEAGIRHPGGDEPPGSGLDGKETFQAQFEQLVGGYNLSDTTSSSNSAKDTSVSHNADYQPRAPERLHLFLGSLEGNANGDDSDDVRFDVDDISIEADSLPSNLPNFKRPKRLGNKKAFVAAVAPLTLFSQFVLGTRVRDAILGKFIYVFLPEMNTTCEWVRNWLFFPTLGKQINCLFYFTMPVFSEEESDDIDGVHVDGIVTYKASDSSADSPQKHRSGLHSSSMDEKVPGGVLGAALIGAAFTATAIVLWFLSRIERRKRGVSSRHPGVLHPRSARWDLERCLLVVDIDGARDVGYLGGAFVAGTSQVTIDLRAQTGTLSYSLIPLFSVDPVAFVRRERRVVREHFKIPAKSCWVSPTVKVREATPSTGETQSWSKPQEIMLPSSRFRNRNDGGFKEHNITPVPLGPYIDAGTSVLVRGVPTLVTEVGNITKADSAKSRMRAEAFKAMGTHEPFVREYTTQGIFDDEVKALVIQLEHSPGPQPVAHRKAVLSPPRELLSKITRHHGGNFRNHIKVGRLVESFPRGNTRAWEEHPMVTHCETASFPQWAAKRRREHEVETRQHQRAGTLCVEASTLNVAGGLCTWDFAIRDKRVLSVFAEVESQSLIISTMEPQTNTVPLEEMQLRGIHVIRAPPECMVSSPHYVAFSRGVIQPQPFASSSVKQRNHTGPGLLNHVSKMVHKYYGDTPSDELQHLRIQVRSLPQSRAFRRIRRLHRVVLPKN